MGMTTSKSATKLTPTLQKNAEKAINYAIEQAKISGKPVTLDMIQKDPAISSILAGGWKNAGTAFVNNYLQEANVKAGLIAAPPTGGSTGGGGTTPTTPTAPAPTAPPKPIDPTMNEPNLVNPSEPGYNVGIAEGGEAGKSAAQILAEADLARKLREETLTSTKEAQTKSISDLRTLLEDEAKTKYERELPTLLEDLNTRGLLRSSELGNQLAIKQQESLKDIATELAKQQLGYDVSNIGELKTINEGYLGGRGSALQREMSLEDFARQLAASKELGAIVSPVTPYQGSSKAAGTGAALTGGLSGAATGNMIVPGVGAGVGAAVGTIGGLLSGK